MKNKKLYTHDEVLGSFNGEIERHINDANRVPARAKLSREDIYDYAQEVYKARYKDALHPMVLDNYKA